MCVDAMETYRLLEVRKHEIEENELKRMALGI